MPSGRDNKHRSRAAAPGFATVAVAVVAALGLSAQPADAAIIPGPVSATVTVPKSHGVTGATALRVAPAPQPARAANFVARSVRWPNAATASVATGPSATFIRAGSTPVSVRRSGGTTTHTQVRVADRATTAALGVHGMVFDLASETAAATQVRVDYGVLRAGRGRQLRLAAEAGGPAGVCPDHAAEAGMPAADTAHDEQLPVRADPHRPAAGEHHDGARRDRSRHQRRWRRRRRHLRGHRVEGCRLLVGRRVHRQLQLPGPDQRSPGPLLPGPAGLGGV